MRTCGPGDFNDYVLIFSADNPHPGYDILSATRQTRASSQALLTESASTIRWPPYPWWPDEGSLLQWAEIEEHDLYWLTDGPADKWPVVVLRSREGLHEQYSMSAAEVLLGILAGPAPGTLLPDLAGSHVTFESSPAIARP